MKIMPATNSRLPQWGLMWLNQVLCFYQSLCLVDSEVLRNPPLRQAAKRWKKLAFWDGVGALKGAWEFGKLGFVLAGGAGAFVVGATGAIFEGASASAAAYLEDRVESFFGL